MNVKGRVKEGAFKFYEPESFRRATLHNAWPFITHDQTTHPRQLVNLATAPSFN